MSSILTPQAQDFPRWYQELLAKAELAENGPVRGTMVIRPYGYSLWERIQAEVDARIKACGAENAYFPLFIPNDYLEREASHVEGFSPELAVVTHGGGKELKEPIVVRPTSETIFGQCMAKWIQSYRDLPLLLNQWCNVVRWELRPRLFLRTSEFLWQEGHTAHATEADAAAYATRILYEVYEDVFRSVLALPVIVGRKTPTERFAGAVNTMTCEAMTRDGKALQVSTSHELGQNFAKAFGMEYLDENGQLNHCWTTSWGSSTRMVGGLIMSHGDDDGLVVPPALAPIQVVVVLVKDEGGAGEQAGKVADELSAVARVRLDGQTAQSFGRRTADWELKGVPVRVEVGQRDLEKGLVTVVRRDRTEKVQVPLAEVRSRVEALLPTVQADMLAAAERRRDDAITDVDSVADALVAAKTGFARVPYDLVRGEGEERLAVDAVTVRCLQRQDGSLPGSDDERGLVAVVGRSY